MTARGTAGPPPLQRPTPLQGFQRSSNDHYWRKADIPRHTL